MDAKFLDLNFQQKNEIEGIKKLFRLGIKAESQAAGESLIEICKERLLKITVTKLLTIKNKKQLRFSSSKTNENFKFLF